MVAARLLAVPVVAAALSSIGAGARADDAVCQAVLQAVLKKATVPVRQRVTIESAAAPGKPMQNEMVRVGDTLERQPLVLPYSSCRRNHGPVSLRPLGARSSHWYMLHRPSTPRT